MRVGRTDADGEIVWSTYFRGSPVYRDFKPLIEAAAKLAARCAAEETTRERSQDG